ncbi:VOC family protein [Actinopolymorpha sp. B11F2]|uniref:VOC family protein n=1 Tax=Actinopolymorpha sp. B11F2 TaxID=3160862 RepID=UPI0032E381E2
MVSLGSIVLKVSSINRAADFWSKALGYVPTDNPAFLIPANGEGTRLHLDEDDRTHLDLWVDEGEEVQAEVERLISRRKASGLGVSRRCRLRGSRRYGRQSLLRHR